MTNSAKISISFSIAAAFLLAGGAAAVFFIDNVNGILNDIRIYNSQVNQIAQTVTTLRTQPQGKRQNAARLGDIEHLTRSDLERSKAAAARDALEKRGSPAEATTRLEELSQHYRKLTAQAHAQLVTLHQHAVHGAILFMGGGTLLLVVIMMLMRRWLMGPLIDMHEAIQQTIAGNSDHVSPKSEVGQVLAPVREFSDRIRQLEDRANRAERLATVGEACTRIGQNLRTLIHSIRTAAQYERAAERADKNAKVAFDHIIATTNSLDHWVGSLVSASRPLELVACRQSVEPVIRDSVSLLQPLLTEHDIKIEIEPADSLPNSNIDRQLLEQAIVAVLKNAIDASTEESRIVITTVAQNGSVRVTIADDGEGMSVETRQRACEPFFTKKKGGVGLGLTHVQRIVELHGGKLAVESAPRGGTRVHIDLPVSAANGGKANA